MLPIQTQPARVQRSGNLPTNVVFICLSVHPFRLIWIARHQMIRRLAMSLFSLSSATRRVPDFHRDRLLARRSRANTWRGKTKALGIRHPKRLTLVF